MSVSTASYAPARAVGWQRAADYLELTKPKIVLMELVTVAVAAIVANAGVPHLWLLIHAVIGTVLIAAGASAWNQWLERHTDALMDRTAERPLPAARLTSREVLVFGTLTSLAGAGYLAMFVNVLTATLGALTWLLYVAVYTPLKSRSPSNTAVGAVAGAMPVLMGWTAVGGRLNITSFTLFLIVFLWQFPHFMAIAWLYRRQYSAAGLKMLTVVDPSGLRAGAQAVVAALALIPVSLLPALISFAGPTYFIWALLLSLGQLACAAAFLLKMNEQTARTLLRASLIYLPALLLWLTVGPFRY